MLPPLEPLIAFEAAARHQSFTAAARELNLSQAAVSQQIRNLERSLGGQLFIRAHRKVLLSSRGRGFQHTVSAALRQLASATVELRAPVAKARLTIAADQSIASMWLLPRLRSFQQMFPDTSLRLVASDDERDCLADDILVSVIHGSGDWPGFHAEQLFGEEVFPVCSPDYLSERGALAGPGDLAREILIELEDSRWDWMNWRMWLSGNGIDLPVVHRRLQINSYPLVIEAARNGQGIALGWRNLVDDDLASGALVRPVAASLGTGFGYYLVWSARRDLVPEAMDFADWAKDELARQRHVRR